MPSTDPLIHAAADWAVIVVFGVVYLGSLFADRIATFRSPIAGAKPPHWDY